MSKKEAATWLFAFASALGNGHKEEGLPCQDACDVLQEEGYTVAVVCDGAGSCAHSDEGAKRVTELAIARFAKDVENTAWHKKEQLPTLKEWREIASASLELISKDLRELAEEKQYEYKSLSCTVIVCIVLPKGLLFAHIGDGRAGYLCDEGWRAGITPFHAEEANATVFITSNIWAHTSEYIGCEVIVRDDISAVCLMSDGCEKAAYECNLYDEVEKKYYDPNRPFAPFFAPNLPMFAQIHSAETPQEEINALWEQFLHTGSNALKIESDDKTMVLGVKIV
jgi:hypothetical protein